MSKSNAKSAKPIKRPSTTKVGKLPTFDAVLTPASTPAPSTGSGFVRDPKDLESRARALLASKGKFSKEIDVLTWAKTSQGIKKTGRLSITQKNASSTASSEHSGRVKHAEGLGGKNDGIGTDDNSTTDAKEGDHENDENIKNGTTRATTAPVEISQLTKAQRAEAALQRRDRVDKERTKAMLISSKTLRTLDDNESKLERKRINELIVYTIVGSRFDLMMRALWAHRENKRVVAWENRCASIITHAMRRNYAIHYQRRLKAWKSMSLIVGAKIGKWKKKRKQTSVKIIIAFLNCLESENTCTNGSLSVISKSKKWLTYKSKVVRIQRFWRQCVLANQAEAVLLNLLWLREHQRLIDMEVESELRSSEEKAAKRNREIATLNFTRQKNRRKLLDPVRPDTRKNIRQRMLVSRERDILTPVDGDGVPDLYIRLKVISQVIRATRRRHLLKTLEIDRNRDLLRSALKERKRQEERNRDGNQTLDKNPLLRSGLRSVILPYSTMIPRTRSAGLVSNPPPRAPISCAGAGPSDILTKCSLTIKDLQCPRFHFVLGRAALTKMVVLTDNFVKELRLAWTPEKMEYDKPQYEDIGEQVASIHCEALYADSSDVIDAISTRKNGDPKI